MIINPEIILLRQPLFCPAQKLQFIVDKIGIIDHPFAFRANQMMMVMLTLGALRQLITGFTVAEVEPGNKSRLSQHIQRSINRCQANVGETRMYTGINILGA